MARPSVKQRRVEVRWRDSTYLAAGWRPIHQALSMRAVVECVTVGLVLADDKKGLVVASSIHDAEAAGIMVIPRGQVVKVRRLR